MKKTMTMDASRLLIVCALAFLGTGQPQTSAANTGTSLSLAAGAGKLVIDTQGMAIDIDATVRDPIRGERSY